MTDEQPTTTRPFKVWCLDDPNSNIPSAEFGGIAVSSTASKDSIDTIFTKRYAADDFDQNLSSLKRRRIEDVSPYVALTKRHGHLHVLQEFVPENLARMLTENVPKPVIRHLLRVIRSLKQEYGYALLTRIIESKIYDLPGLLLFEELERGLVALQAEKITAKFFFQLTYSICGNGCTTPMVLEVSS
jgi:hypothetical protein